MAAPNDAITVNLKNNVINSDDVNIGQWVKFSNYMLTAADGSTQTIPVGGNSNSITMNVITVTLYQDQNDDDPDVYYPGIDTSVDIPDENFVKMSGKITSHSDENVEPCLTSLQGPWTVGDKFSLDMVSTGSGPEPAVAWYDRSSKTRAIKPRSKTQE